MSNGISISPAWRRGVADALLRALIASTGTAGIFRERIGQIHARWRDVILIERRSPVVG